MKSKIILTIFLTLFLLHKQSFTQSIPSHTVISVDNLADYLKDEARNEISASSIEALAAAFRRKFSERFFFDYQSFHERLPHYNALYKNQKRHHSRALDHMAKYDDTTQWKLPFNYLNGEPVNAYALRHLARQHKMVDIALSYFNDGKNPEYIQYFENQMHSLNAALDQKAYETIKDGNGVYEAFRCGYRVLNWLWIHNMFLGEEEYGDEDQLYTIATLLQHGQHLYENNAVFRSGNHQTRGVSALAMLSILFQDFEGTDLWLDRAMLRLGEHLDQEINEDGFQFERSVHYHMSDINNYFYVYQLAKLNAISIDQSWEDKLRGLFTTLIKIAYPDRSAPVLQDDTEIPWAETNDISAAMTLGYLLFEDPRFAYFASNKVADRVYWFLSKDQINLLEDIKKEKPNYASLALEDTGYFIMREGWEEDDMMMVVSAGLDKLKPDHQHGDMLGIQAMANGHAILPNYQVRYSLSDFDLFKNSLVKNVALVDNELQGKQWTSNKGGSGFGKFGRLPEPTVIAWESNEHFDFFVGSHDGFENVNVDYTRQVIFIKDEFWIIKDVFHSLEEHEYKQVWQGHYTDENGPNLIRSVEADASGHDILQLNDTDAVTVMGARGKEWSLVSKAKQQDYDFLTIIYPFKKYNDRLDETDKDIKINDWKVNESTWQIEGRYAKSLSSEKGTFLFNAVLVKTENWMIKASAESDLFLKAENGQLHVYAIGSTNCQLLAKPLGADKETKIELKPGEMQALSI